MLALSLKEFEQIELRLGDELIVLRFRSGSFEKPGHRIFIDASKNVDIKRERIIDKEDWDVMLQARRSTTKARRKKRRREVQ